MPRTVGQRIGALFRTSHDTEVGMVMTANGIASLAIGVFAVFELGVGPGLGLALIPLSFLALAACLFDRRTVWIAAALGGAINGGALAAFAVALTDEMAPAVPWLAGVLAFLMGVAGTAWTYRHVARLVAKG
jgi:hypothetical protein